MSTANYTTVAPGSQYSLSTSADAVPNYGANESEYEKMLRDLTARRISATRRRTMRPAVPSFRVPPALAMPASSPADHGGSIFGSNAAAEGMGTQRYLVPVGLGAQMIPGMGPDMNDPRQRPSGSVVGGYLPPSAAGVTPSAPARSIPTPADDWYSLPEWQRTQILEANGYGARDMARRSAMADPGYAQGA